ncbi:hypothetical protein NNC19_08345 [Clostridium sp. SHJSY1]|uniref:hypothetical protein n=1 Tax=Clostridium sp. SHJSY1 TaxID=2942483 RepID=UPI00287517B5|nr:hypothetical protein [Clostridium sp. SHJSY1]MDS0525685.1 hypothetical protein [Clostridium sp. SHJSY1]
MVRKKRGASLVSVVIISGVVITMGTAMLTLTVGDYKARMNESSRIKNLYSSELGLDVGQEILGKNFDAGVKYSISKVEEYKKSDYFINKVAEGLKDDLKNFEASKKQISQSTDSNKVKELIELNKKIDETKKSIQIEEENNIDTYFKKIFNDFVYMDVYDDKYKNEINTEVNKDELRKSIVGKEYIKNINEIDTDKRYAQVNFSNNSVTLLVDDTEKNKDEGKNAGISYTTLEAGSDRKYSTRKYTIKITSSYTTSDRNGTNERKLQSIYNITVPDYKDVAYSESNGGLANYEFLEDKALIVGKNMNITSDLSITGNTFVQGEPTGDISSRVYDKYNGGIVLDASSSEKVEFTGDVITGRTFNIRDNINSIINGDLYAMNVYAGNQEKESMADGSTLLVKNSDNTGKVIVDNDITLKASRTKIIIDEFYGINDKNINYGDSKTTIDSKLLDRTSSSIIVNGNKESSVKINKKAYIMGVAHINTKNEEGYTTGESTGVKGNYIAYAYPTNNDEKFDYYEPLQLLDEDNIIKKSEHFVQYWKDKLDKVNTGGIELPDESNIYSIGALVYKDSNGETKVVNSSYSLDGQNSVKDKKEEFAEKVYNLGGKKLEDWEKLNLYESLGTSKDKVEDLMITNSQDEAFIKYKNANGRFFKGSVDVEPNEQSNNEKFIISDKNIKIVASTSSSENKDGISTEGDDTIVINVPEKSSVHKLNAFIATKGNVTITGNIDFEGFILAQGNLEIIGDGNTIKYNKDLVNRITASNAEVFNSVFGHMRQDIDASQQQSSEAAATIDYDRNKFVKDMIWKIVK